jgi:hypothetical protein
VLLNWSNAKTITVQKMGITGTDAYNDDVYGVVSSADVQAVLVPLLLKRPPRATRPGGFGEELEGEFVVATGLTMFVPADSDIKVTDQVLINGELWNVDGDPGVLTSPFSGMSLAQVQLDRVTG